MVATWPETLPPAPMVAGSSYQPVSNATPIPVEAGELLTRRRFTGAMTRLNVALVLTRAQALTLMTFYRDELAETLPFVWTDPLTETEVEMMFEAAPQLQPLGADRWAASLTLVTKPQVATGSPA